MMYCSCCDICSLHLLASRLVRTFRLKLLIDMIRATSSLLNLSLVNYYVASLSRDDATILMVRYRVENAK